MIWICRSETLLDDREILVLRERSIVVRIGIGELFRSQSAARSLTTSCVRLELRSLPSPELPGFSGTTNPSASPGRPACPSRASGWSSLPTPWVSRVAYAFLVYMLSPLPRCSGWAYCFAHSPQPYQPSPKGLSGGPAHRPFRGLLGVHLHYGLLSPIRDTHSEGFSYFVTSIAAPAASGWSVRRVGLTPTGKRHLVTAHTRNGHLTSTPCNPSVCMGLR